jgi:serine/threonine protein kinase
MHAFNGKMFFAKLLGYSENPLTLVFKHYPQGTLLRYETQARNSLTKRRAIIFANNICTALREMHNFGVLHGGISSQNILIDEYVDGRVFCVLSGFDNSRVVQSGETSPIFVSDSSSDCSAAYAAPEKFSMMKNLKLQPINAEKVTKIDIFSIGILIQEMMNRFPPWHHFRR